MGFTYEIDSWMNIDDKLAKAAEAKKFESTSKREVSKEYVDKCLKNAGKRLKSGSTR